MKNKALSMRWGILAIGILSLFFAGILYAWSILKIPFATDLSFTPDSLSLNFTLTMSFFCIGCIISGWLANKIGVRMTLLISGFLSGIGFVLTSIIREGGEVFLYATYAATTGTGIGIAYITIISTVNSWFPDRRGISSGSLMMGFGMSSLVLGSAADALFASSIGWRRTFIIFGIALFAILLIASMVIKRPDESVQLPAPKAKSVKHSESFEAKDYTPVKMIRNFTFWRAFIFFIFIAAVGNSTISFARDLAVSVGATAAIATTLVGVLSVFNGLGRIISGAIFDAAGCRITMLTSAIVTVSAAGISLVSTITESLPLCVIGLALTGISYGAVATASSSFIGAFYGQKHYASNFGITMLHLMVASFAATACSALITSTGTYVAPFILLLSLSVAAFVINLTIKKP